MDGSCRRVDQQKFQPPRLWLSQGFRAARPLPSPWTAMSVPG